eukprot:9845039-Karenia_brevis.AAC.1
MPDAEHAPLTDEQPNFWATPGACLPHMRIAPRDLKDVQVTGFARWSGPPLACPPDGKCLIYAFLAAQDPRA